MNTRLLIATDLGLLNAYLRTSTPKGTPRLELIETIQIEDAHRRVGDKVTDFAGRRAMRSQHNWGAPMADDHSLRLENKRRLVRQISGHIKRIARAAAAEDIWLAAPKEINHLIVSELPLALRARIEVNLARDLAKTGKRELLKCFSDTLAPV